MDIEGLLRSLNEHNVDYVVIGATAFPVYGYARATLDVDLFVRPAQDNITRLREALKAFGYDLADVSEDDLMRHKVLIRQCLVETDVHPFVKGVTFDEVWSRAVEDSLGAVRARFASLEDLIVMKEAAARPKDLQDLEVLRRLLRAQKG